MTGLPKAALDVGKTMSNFIRKCRLYREALTALERIADDERAIDTSDPFQDLDLYSDGFLAGYRQALRDASHKFMDIF